MRTVKVYCCHKYAGVLKELSKHDYEFIYDDKYISDDKYPSVSVNLPKNKKAFHSSRIFPFFVNMLPEGANRRAMCTAKKVDEHDFFGMLVMICDIDCIGSVMLRK